LAKLSVSTPIASTFNKSALDLTLILIEIDAGYLRIDAQLLGFLYLCYSDEKQF
jgi:hypothetical protein